jgi:hypothetical protein
MSNTIIWNMMPGSRSEIYRCALFSGYLLILLSTLKMEAVHSFESLVKPERCKSLLGYTKFPPCVIFTSALYAVSCSKQFYEDFNNIITYPGLSWLIRRVLDLIIEFCGPLYNRLQQFTNHTLSHTVIFFDWTITLHYSSTPLYSMSPSDCTLL